MALPLAVRISTARGDRQISSEVAAPSFRKTAKGGHASAQIKLHRPLTLQAGEVDLFADIEIVDERNGGTVWNGQLQDPGRSLADGGQIFDITALGPASHAQDITAPYMAVDSTTDHYQKFGGSKVSGEVGQAENASGTDGVKVGFASGALVLTNEYVDGYSRRIDTMGLDVASIAYTVTGGGNSASFEVQAYAYQSETLLDARELSTSSDAVRFTIDDWDSGDTNIHLRIIRTGVDATPDDHAFALFTGLAWRTTLLFEYGDPVTDYDNDFVYAHEVVADLIGRRLPEYDGSDAFIQTTTHEIDQLCYPDGVTAAQVLDDLMELEPAYFWTAGRKVPLTGKYKFRWETWPTSVRYQCDVTDGFSAPGSAGELYNAVQVRWTDSRGRRRTTRRTSNVPVLTAAGKTREFAIDLGDQAGSSSNAARAGDSFLAEHAVPVNTGTLTIARPILDVIAGRMIQPWEIEPGNLIRVRGVLPKPDSLNASDRDGVTVFRVTSVEFDAESCSATLELDSYDRTTWRALADLAASRGSRRR